MSDIKEIVFENIDENYGYGKYGDFKIIMNINTGFINATKLCKDGGKEFKHWLKNSQSKKFIETFSNCLRISKDEILMIVTGGRNTIIRGTYVHPDIIPHIAMWISPKFGITISKIVNEWRQISHNNVSYWTEMGDCIKNFPSKENDNEEHSWRDKIALEENGKIEVEVESGVIDVLTEFKIIEVKKVENWKHAVGQVLIYSLDFEPCEFKKEPTILCVLNYFFTQYYQKFHLYPYNTELMIMYYLFYHKRFP